MVDIKKLINVFEPRYEETDIDTTSTSLFNTTDIEVEEPPDENSENSETRLDDLRYDLRKTIEDSFDLIKETTGDDGKLKIEQENERKMSVDDPTVNKFRTYVRNVSVYAKTRCQRRKNTLFECCLIVEWNADVRRIKFQYPHNVEVPYKIEDLCFPDVTYGPLDKTINAQCYSLVITDDKGERTFGYCRRVVPEGSNNCLPIVYCILSKHKSPRFYKKLLIELESRHGLSEIHRNNLLEALYFNKFPQPGETITIKLSENTKESNEDDGKTAAASSLRKSVSNDSLESNFVIVNDKGDFESSKDERISKIFSYDSEENSDIILNLHHDPIFEISDLKDLHELPMEILQKIFASLLLERKVILISCLLSKLSSCVDALQAMIYPFTWPHSFIPVLPKSLWEFVEAPTPIICGILSIEVINKHEIEHGIVIDLDEKCILKEEGDEDSALSSCMLKAWRKSIAIAKNIPVEKEAHSYHLTEAYIHMFAVALKNYRDYIVYGNFQKEAFIRSNKSKGVRRFLKWFTDTTMFLTFVDSVITNSQDFSLFDKKLALYGSEQSGLILDKLLDWKISS